jgi:hypothetical protein
MQTAKHGDGDDASLPARRVRGTGWNELTDPLM